MTIRVVLAEDNVLLREGVSRLVDAQDGLELAGVCGDLPSLLALVESAKPDVVVTDIRMPPSGTDEGIRAAAALRTDHPAIGVVVLSQYAEPGLRPRPAVRGVRGPRLPPEGAGQRRRRAGRRRSARWPRAAR